MEGAPCAQGGRLLGFSRLGRVPLNSEKVDGGLRSHPLLSLVRGVPQRSLPGGDGPDCVELGGLRLSAPSLGLRQPLVLALSPPSDAMGP